MIDDETQAQATENVPADGVPANDVRPEEAPAAPSPDEEIASLKDQLLRALAETENARRRAQRDREDASRFAIQDFAQALLDVADNLRQALSAVPANGGEDALAALRQGVELTERTLASAFERHGVKRFDPKGERFDPHRHQAVFEVETADSPPGTVVQVLRAGYILNDRLLRPAMVGVAKGAQAEPAAGGVDTTA
ncbi:MAG: nucleotide exchange factor GrpE [Alphaproteobacteria bacterium]